MATKFTSEMSCEEQLAELINRSKGTKQREGYDCPLCLNREFTIRVEQGRRSSVACSCVVIRNNIARLRRRGLLELSDRCTFERFTAHQPWQSQMKAMVEEYLESGSREWRFLAGQSGCGKTHLCTAAATQMICAGRDVQVFRWVEWSSRTKSLISDQAGYNRAVQPLKDCDVLFLDDFLKTPGCATPTQADLRLAFEVLDARYQDPDKSVILCSEFSPDQIVGFDEALGGRIAERAAHWSITVKNQESRNHRLFVSDGMSEGSPQTEPVNRVRHGHGTAS